MENISAQNELSLMLIIITAFVMAAIIITWAFVSPNNRPRILAFEGVVAPFFGLPAVLFSLMSALFATSIWDNYSVATKAIRNESQSILNLVSLADSIPALKNTKISEYAKEYTRSVVEDEWQTLSADKTPSPKTKNQFNQLRTEIFRSGERLNKTEFEGLVNAYLRLNNARETRLAFVSFDIHPTRWYAVLFLGFLVQVAVAFVHLSKPKALIIAMMIATSTELIPICMITLTFSSPYNGSIAISKIPYLQILE